MSATLEACEPAARYLAPPLLRHFNLVAQAPGGVARLRELILTLAVQGKLVPQNPADEPASVLLERIREEKARLVKDGKIRKEKPLAGIGEEEKPFGLPAGWTWIRLIEAVTLENGDRGNNYPSKGDFVASGIRFINAGHLRDHRVEKSEMNFISEERFASLRSGKIQKSDILYCLRGSLGKTALIDDDEPGAIASSLVIIRRTEGLDAYFVLLYLASPLATSQIRKFDNGTAQPNLGASDLAKFLVPLPPLLEQSRIVARVKELIALCDALEEKGRLEAARHERLAGVLFDALANSISAEEAAENWQRIAPHFDLLLDRPAAVDRLEQTILHLAVRGRLVPQNPADEPANVLLDRLRSQKNQLVAEGKIRREKPLKETTDDEDSLVPEGWATVTFPELCSIGGGATPSKAKANYWDGNIPWVSPKDMKVDFISDAQDHVSQIALEETSLTLIPRGSLLIVVRGMILAHSFPVGVTQAEVTINQDMKSLTPVFPALTPYLALVCKGFKSEILQLVERSSHGTCKLESDKLFAFRFGLPPLAEQSRIVARVKELRVLCAQLRQKLTDSQQTQSRLAEALLEKAAA